MLSLCLLACLALPCARAGAQPRADGRLVRLDPIASRYVADRRVDVWLPPGYDADAGARYPVIYAQDGQNLFDPATSYTGVDWGIDEAMTRLIAQARVRPAIVVGIWNTPQRFGEYMPQTAVAAATVASGIAGAPAMPRSDLASDAYLRYLVRELKPKIDSRFRTRRGRDDTFVMGSSMGGLISAYAVARYPRVFGAAACLSTHWPAGDGVAVAWLAAHLPDPRTHRFYFDHGTATLDAGYAPDQMRIDAAARKAGYVTPRQWTSRTFAGAAHDETAWRARVDVPLGFLLGPTRASASRPRAEPANAGTVPGRSSGPDQNL